MFYVKMYNHHSSKNLCINQSESSSKTLLNAGFSAGVFLATGRSLLLEAIFGIEFASWIAFEVFISFIDFDDTDESVRPGIVLPTILLTAWECLLFFPIPPDTFVEKESQDDCCATSSCSFLEIFFFFLGPAGCA